MSLSSKAASGIFWLRGHVHLDLSLEPNSNPAGKAFQANLTAILRWRLAKPTRKKRRKAAEAAKADFHADVSNRILAYSEQLPGLIEPGHSSPARVASLVGNFCAINPMRRFSSPPCDAAIGTVG